MSGQYVDEEVLPTLVIDVGSGELKCGFGGEDAPRKVFPNLLGWPRHPGVGGIMLGEKKDNYVGHGAVEKQGLLKLNQPVTRGIVTDWLDMEKVLHHAFYCELTVAPDEHPVLITETPDNPRQNRERMTEMIFETFNAPALSVASQACMGIFATGRSTGIAVDSGCGVTHVCPVWEGYSLPHYITKLELAGSDLTDYLFSLLRQRGLPFSTPDDRRFAEDIKEKLCYVCNDFEQELHNASISRSFERQYVMPDGEKITLIEDRFRCPEVLFNPSMVQCESPGIHVLAHQCVQKCDQAVRREMYANLVLCGGNTLFPRLEDRLSREVQELAPKGMQAKCVAFPERKYSAWLGGSLLASLSTFPCMWLAKKEYDDFGASAIHKKAL
eukprot:TRINITY_DN50321_c0_g1_i1.p1 TRINITY_DN50321_c0_g1~~TRINITY_DN50321_c0_g1_i1.p1  ORF type:complete len:415 (+),score=162.29 TRINITY_DN50321_c0_g1_i1:95-1246(+)